MALLIKNLNVADVFNIRQVINEKIIDNNSRLENTTDEEIKGIIIRENELLNKILGSLNYNNISTI